MNSDTQNFKNLSSAEMRKLLFEANEKIALLQQQLELQNHPSSPRTPGTLNDPIALKSVVAEAFDAKYVMPTTAMTPKDLYDYLVLVSELADKPNRQTDHVVALVQSSGFGKSRLACEMALAYPWVTYVNFTTSPTAYPPGTPFASLMNAIFTEQQTEEGMVTKIQGLLAKFLTACAENGVATPEQRTGWLIRCRTLGDLPTESQPLKIAAETARPAIFIFDEAASLLDPIVVGGKTVAKFRILRRALRVNHVVGLFLGTNSKIQNFAPSLRRNPSHRPADTEHILPLPVWAVGCWDLGRVKSNGDIDHTSSTLGAGRDHTVFPGPTYAEWAEPINLAAFGRPLWFAIRSVENLMNFVEEKLRCAAPTLGRNCRFAMVAICVRARLTAGVDFPESLVADHLGVLKFVTESRELLFIDYPSEPLLAWAAFRSIIVNGPLAFVKDVISLVCSGYADRGQGGELVARVVLLIGMGRSFDGGDKVPNATVKSFLLNTFGGPGEDEENKEMKRKTPILDGVVSFTHFLRTTGEVTPELLVDAIMRRAAIIARPRQRGYDLVVPVFLGDKSKQISVDNVGAIAIQIKNRQHTLSTNIIHQDVEAAVEVLAGRPILSLVLQRGTKECLWCELQPTRKLRRTSRARAGLCDYLNAPLIPSTSAVTPELREHLRVLTDADVDFDALAEMHWPKISLDHEARIDSPVAEKSHRNNLYGPHKAFFDSFL